MNRKLIVSLMTLTLCMGALTGCGESKETTVTSVAPENIDPFGKYEEPISLTSVLSFGAAPTGVKAGVTPDDNSFVNELKERFNIDFKWLWTAPTDQYNQKLGVAMASSQLPDIMSVNNIDYQNLLENEQIMSWNDVLPWASDTLKEWIYSDPGVLETVTTDEGEIMALPQYWDPKRNLNIMMIRTDWLEEVGMKIPETVEELEAVATAFVEKKGADTGISVSKDVMLGTASLASSMNMFGSYPGKWTEDKEGNLIPGEVQPESREALETLSRFYKNGLIHREYALHDGSKLKELVMTEELGIMIAPWWAFDAYIGSEIAKNKDSKWATTTIPMVAGTKGAIIDKYSIEDYWVINKDCKNPEAVMKVFNLFAEFETTYPDAAKPENGYAWNWVPATFFDPYDIQQLHDSFNEQIATGDFQTLPEGLLGPNVELWQEAENYYNWKAGEIEYPDTNKWGKYLGRIDEEFAWGTTKRAVDAGQYETNQFYDAPTPTMRDRKGTLDKLTEEIYTKIVMGELPIDAFDKYVNDWMSLGGEEMIAEVNEWYDAQ